MTDPNEIKKKFSDIDREFSRLRDRVNKLEKQGDVKKTDSYLNYYFDSDGVTPKEDIINRLSETIDQEGTILEIKATELLRKKKYSIDEYYYEDRLQGKVRALDILARKTHNFNIGSTKVSLHVDILADCKYRSQLDLLFFDTGDRIADALKFPIFASPDYNFRFCDSLKSKQDLFTSSKVTQIQLDAYSKKGHHLNSDEIHSASSQVYSAVRSYYEEIQATHINRMKTEFRRSAYAKHLLAKEEEGVLRDHEVDGLLKTIPRAKSVSDLLSGIEVLSFTALLPLVIFDEKRGILKATLDEHHRLKSIENLRLGLYRFPKGFIFNDDDYHGDYIILCNLEGLEILTKYIERYMKYYERKFYHLFSKFPMTLFHLLNIDDDELL